jgi:hypothetical protein
MIFTLFLIAMQNVISAFHGPSAVSAEKNCRIQDRRREVCNTVRFCSPRTSAAQPASTHVVRNRTDRTGQPHKAARADSHLDFKVLTGLIESFFIETSKPGAAVGDRSRFEAHRMRVVGQPLSI